MCVCVNESSIKKKTHTHKRLGNLCQNNNSKEATFAHKVKRKRERKKSSEIVLLFSLTETLAFSSLPRTGV